MSLSREGVIPKRRYVSPTLRIYLDQGRDCHDQLGHNHSPQADLLPALGTANDFEEEGREADATEHGRDDCKELYDKDVLDCVVQLMFFKDIDMATESVGIRDTNEDCVKVLAELTVCQLRGYRHVMTGGVSLPRRSV